MQRLGGVEDVGAGAGRVEGAGNLEADVGGLAGPGDGDAAEAVVGGAADQFDGLLESGVEALGDEFEGGRFGAKDLAGVAQAVVAGRRGRGLVDLQRHVGLLAPGANDPSNGARGLMILALVFKH